MVSAEESGQIIIELADLEESKIKEVLRFGTSLVSQATKTPTGVQVSALPTMPSTAYKGKRVIISFVADATDIIESEECNMTMPLNYIDEKTGMIAFSKDVSLEGFTGFKPSGTVDITCTASTKQRLCYLDVPVGYLVTLGTGRKFHAYIGDDTA